MRKKKKDLQKFTEIESLTAPDEVREYLTNNPDSYYSLLENLQERYSNSFQNKLGKEHEIFEMVSECYKFKNKPELEIKLRNITFETNHAFISSYIHNYINANRRFPTIQGISQETGLSRTTIYNHLSEGLATKHDALIKGKLEYMTSSALVQLYHIGVNESNATALKYFIELSGATMKAPDNVNTYIQINNIKLSLDEFQKLPAESIEEIENIISKVL